MRGITLEALQYGRDLEFSLLECPEHRFHEIESILLLLGSPEGAIWHAEDATAPGDAFRPKRFSGPYAVTKTKEDGAPVLLERNEYCRTSSPFPKSPKAIEIATAKEQEAYDRLVAEGGADIWLEPVTPFDPNGYAKHYKRHYTTPSMMIYLERINRKGQDAKIGRDLLEAMWSGTLPEHLIAAETFLPFGSMTALDRNGFLAELPETTTRRPLRIAAISPFYRPGFLSFLKARARAAGIHLDFATVTFKEYLDLISDYDKAAPFDFVLSPYMASERYPAVRCATS